MDLERSQLEISDKNQLVKLLPKKYGRKWICSSKGTSRLSISCATGCPSSCRREGVSSERKVKFVTRTSRNFLLIEYFYHFPFMCWVEK